jgi:hypothetical protein
MYIKSKGGASDNAFAFIFGLGVQRDASIGECPMFRKKLLNGAISVVSFKKKKNCEHTHMNQG